MRRPWGEGSLHIPSGYVFLTVDGKRKKEHIHIAEQAVGKPLPPGVQVHHFNLQRDDNRPQNLVVCPDQAYHQLLHVRTEALEACGHADWRKCTICKEYDAPENLRFSSGGAGNKSPKVVHQKCETDRKRERRHQLRCEME